jgi:ABC-type uncharacterized transport system substrate-binding protein
MLSVFEHRHATGISDIGVELGAKRLGLLHELVPAAARFGVLVNPDNPFLTEPFVAELLTAASAIGRQIEVLTARTNNEIDAAFAIFVNNRVNAFLMRCLWLVAYSSRHWPHVMRSRRCITAANLPKPAD